jgi:hypothetical protein
LKRVAESIAFSAVFVVRVWNYFPVGTFDQIYNPHIHPREILRREDMAPILIAIPESAVDLRLFT